MNHAVSLPQSLTKITLKRLTLGIVTYPKEGLHNPCRSVSWTSRIHTMKPEVRFHRFPGHIAPGLRPFLAAGGRLPGLQAHSSLRSLKNLPSGHPQIAQGKQRDELSRVLGQATVSDLGKSDFKHQAPGGQGGIDGGHQLDTEVVFFEQVAWTWGFAKSQHGGDRKGWASCLAGRRMRLNQANQLRPGHHQGHLIKELALARSLGHKLKSGAGKAYLFHRHSTFGRATGLTYAENP